MIKKNITEKNRKLDSSLCFKLYDTYGFPFELTSEILKERNITASKEEFDKYMESQRALARQNAKKINDLKVLGDVSNFKEESVFTGYDSLEEKAKVILPPTSLAAPCEGSFLPRTRQRIAAAELAR